MPSRSRYWAGAALAAAAAAGVAFWALRDGTSVVVPPVPVASAATHAGTAACASCHAKEHAAWRGSHHDRAMEVATNNRCSATSPTRASRTPGTTSLLPSRRSVLRQHRRAGRHTRRLRDQVHVRRPSAAAVPDRAARRAHCRRSASLGTRVRRRRAGSAGSTSTRIASSRPATRCTGPASTRTGTTSAPTATRPTCARTTTTRPAPTERRGRKSTSVARPVTARARTTSPGRSSSRMHAGLDASKGLPVVLDERPGVTWRSTPRPATRRAPRRERRAARSRPARGATRGAASSTTRGIPAPPLGNAYRVALLDAGPLLRRRADARRGLQPRLVPAEPHARARASPAPTATIRTARSCARPATPCADSATRRRASTRRAHASPGGHARRGLRRRATCRRRPTWWSTRGTTTRCASRGPTYPSRSAPRTPAATATRKRGRSGRPDAVAPVDPERKPGQQTFAEALPRGSSARPARRPRSRRSTT